MIREGRSFTESLETAGWIPELAIDMIGVGERSGSLREMLDEVAVFFDAESEVRLEQLTTVLEPAILLVMGGIVITIDDERDGKQDPSNPYRNGPGQGGSISRHISPCSMLSVWRRTPPAPAS